MSGLVRRCPQCGRDNVAEAAFCADDARPLFDVEPAPRGGGAAAEVKEETADAGGPGAAANEATHRFDAATEAWLESVSDADCVVRVWDGAVVGRGDNADVDLWPVKQSLRVSRRHAFFHRREGRWYMQSAPDITNYTAVNGERLEEGEQAALSEGDHVAFTDVVFIFHDQPRRAS